MATDDRGTFLDLYRSRLGIDKNVALSPTKDTLDFLVERHLQNIPFSNLEMHTTQSTQNQQAQAIISLAPENLVEKILIQRRGGCCLELNGLFARLLQEVGYDEVRLIPCWIYASRERGHNSGKGKFRTKQTHFFLYVSQKYLVDVGLGEPPMPLEYHRLGEDQLTVDGLKHRIRKDPRIWKDGTGHDRHCRILEWRRSSGWVPRLQWDEQAVQITRDLIQLESFQYVVDILVSPTSTFTRKMVVCALDRTSKRTLSGRTFKITTPRTSENAKIYQENLSDEEVYNVLESQFGMCLTDQGTTLDLTRSDEAKNSPVWAHL